MSAICLNQTSWSSSFRPLKRIFGALQPGGSATEKWEALGDTMYRTALATFGKKFSKSHDWFEAKSTVMTPVIKAKRSDLAEYKCAPSERNLRILRIARNKAQQTARCCANQYKPELSENIQSAAIAGNIRECTTVSRRH